MRYCWISGTHAETADQVGLVRAAQPFVDVVDLTQASSATSV